MKDNFFAQHKKARYQYEIIETLEAGICLQGSEVKSIKQKKISLEESYIVIKKRELYLQNSYIEEYEFSNQQNHKPQASRKLLVHKRELEKLIVQTTQKGLTIVPLKVYPNNRTIKVLIGVARGKNQVDKREDAKKREAIKAARSIKNLL